ncbi:PREDICTED: protein PF14_0175-like [Papilio xuthus]|uniref:Protein PF14_0175-like n=1 Tax=Papilio xuthus TaxID=66420 RepID=A0AAJ7EDA9_PAPXU|nr:PREDICTED: protein PF14_0175-like [Papilio xuthus]
MKFVNKSIWILVVFLVIENVRCQNGYSDQNSIHLKNISPNGGEIETNSSYSTNFAQNEPKSLSFSSGNAPYYMVDNDNNFSDYDRADRGRTRKIYRIKNPFHHADEESRQKENIGSQDSDTGSSNQYAGLQYSLPPEEFLQQMRAESQYNQQQQPQLQHQQISTPSPTFGYTATPQPQYQYSTVPSNYNNGNQQNNLISQSESRYPPQFYNNNLNSYQYNNAHSFGIEAIQSTPSSVTLYLSTSSPNNQYIGTPSSNYVSSSSPIFSSSPANAQSYISTTLSNIISGSPSHNNVNRHSLNVERDAFNYGTNYRDRNQNVYVNHFDNSANGIKYPNMQQQYQNEMPSSTQIPVSSIYPDISRDNWQNSMHLSLNNLPNSRSEYTQAPQQNLQSNYQENQQNSNLDNPSNDMNQIGSMPSANNVVLSIVQPDYKTHSDLKNREKEIEQQNKQEDVYSHGDYGWKLEGRKPLVNYDVNLPINYPNQQNNYQSDGSSLSFSYRQIDNGKNHDYEQKSKYKIETTDTQEFAKAAAKAQENMKNQQETYLNNYILQARYPQNILTNADPGNFMINNNNHKSLTNDKTNLNGQADLITQSSQYFQNPRENIFDNKIKQPLDQENDLQNFIKVGGANNIPNFESRQQDGGTIDANNKYFPTNYSKDLNENLKQFLKPFSDTYKMKNNEIFSPDNSRQIEPSYENLKKYELLSNSNSQAYKPHSDINLSPFNGLGQSVLGAQPLTNVQQQRSQNQGSSDNSNSLKLNDIPYWLQGMKNMHFSQLQTGVNQGIIPTGTPLLLNQNIESHQIDVATSILSKLLRDKQIEMNSKQEYDPQRETLLPTINGIKVMNPYNLDLSMVNEFIKGKTSDVSPSFRNQYNQPNPVKWDMSQLKQLLFQNDNTGQYTVLSNVLGSPGSPFFELNTGNRLPYQGVKYSRSQEEAETLIPITDSTHNHPIGAVIEQDDLEHENREAIEPDLEASNNDEFPVGIGDDKPKMNPNYRMIGNRYRNPNSLLPDRYTFRKNPRMVIGEPYPLLKPPPIRGLKGRMRNKFDNNRRQRGNKYKQSRIVKREPLFEEDSDDDVEENVPIHLRPSHLAEDKSDITQTSES